MLSKKELSNLVKTKTVAEIAGMYGVTVQAVYSIGNYGSIDYNSNPCRLQFCSKENIKKFYDLIYSTEAFHLKRKKQIFDNIFEYDKNRRK